MTVTASAPFAETYFQRLEAPKGKHLIWFENSGHWPQLEEPEKFRAVLTDELSKTKLETAK